MLKDMVLWLVALAGTLLKKLLPLYGQFPTKPKADICLPQGGIFHAAIL